MVHILGKLLPDLQTARFALTHFYGIGPTTAHRICARMQIHDTCKVRDLTPNQITAITAFLSSPHTAPDLPHLPLAQPRFQAPARLGAPQRASGGVKPRPIKDPLKALKIEAELRREVRENIVHLKVNGSYVGRRHALGLPVRGQNTQNNAQNAKKLNRVERYN